MALTANDEMLDAVVRHQIMLQRFSTRQARFALELLEASDKEVTQLLQDDLTEDGGKRLESLLKSIRQNRKAVMTSINEQLVADMPDFANQEANWQIATLEATIPVEITINAVAPTLLKAVVGKPINGVPLEGWLGDLADKDVRRIEQQLRLGIVQGESIQQMVTRVRGTKAAKYEDGVLSVTKRNAETIVRTAVNHVSTAARQETWNANKDILDGVRWVSTLDGRTSSTCQGRDGHIYPVDSGPRPPAHPGCRSTITPVLKGEAIVGERPTITDTRTRDKREVDFRAQAKEEMGEAEWKKMTAAQRNAEVARVRKQWTKENIGQTPSNVTYNTWLGRQSKGFQDEVLGPARGELFRSGVPLDKFTDNSGKQYNLTQLKDHVDSDTAELITKLQGTKK